MAGDVHERQGGDVRSGGKGTKVDAGGTITDGKGTTVSTTERAGPPAPRPETRGEFRVARGTMPGLSGRYSTHRRMGGNSKYDVTQGHERGNAQ